MFNLYTAQGAAPLTGSETFEQHKQTYERLLKDQTTYNEVFQQTKDAIRKAEEQVIAAQIAYDNLVREGEGAAEDSAKEGPDGIKAHLDKVKQLNAKIKAAEDLVKEFENIGSRHEEKLEQLRSITQGITDQLTFEENAMLDQNALKTFEFFEDLSAKNLSVAQAELEEARKSLENAKAADAKAKEEKKDDAAAEGDADENRKDENTKPTVEDLTAELQTKQNAVEAAQRGLIEVRARLTHEANEAKKKQEGKIKTFKSEIDLNKTSIQKLEKAHNAALEAEEKEKEAEKKEPLSKATTDAKNALDKATGDQAKLTAELEAEELESARIEVIVSRLNLARENQAVEDCENMIKAGDEKDATKEAKDNKKRAEKEKENLVAKATAAKETFTKAEEAYNKIKPVATPEAEADDKTPAPVYKDVSPELGDKLKEVHNLTESIESVKKKIAKLHEDKQTARKAIKTIKADSTLSDSDRAKQIEEQEKAIKMAEDGIFKLNYGVEPIAEPTLRTKLFGPGAQVDAMKDESKDLTNLRSLKKKLSDAQTESYKLIHPNSMVRYGFMYLYLPMQYLAVQTKRLVVSSINKTLESIDIFVGKATRLAMRSSLGQGRIAFAVANFAKAKAEAASAKGLTDTAKEADTQANAAQTPSEKTAAAASARAAAVK